MADTPAAPEAEAQPIPAQPPASAPQTIVVTVPQPVPAPDPSAAPSVPLTAGGVIALLLMALVALFVFFVHKPAAQSTSPQTTNADGTIDATAPDLNTGSSNNNGASLTQ